MKPSAFAYERPASVMDALSLLQRYRSSARILAGGQSLVPMMNLRLVRPQVLIDVNRLDELARIETDGDELVIGAMVRHAALAGSGLRGCGLAGSGATGASGDGSIDGPTGASISETVREWCPLMSEAYQYVAHAPIRSRGTLGGNVSHADPSSEMPAVLLACDATMVIRSAEGERRVPAADFFVGLMQTALQPHEMLVSIRIPRAPAGQGWAFEEESRRKGDFAMTAVAVTLSLASPATPSPASSGAASSGWTSSGSTSSISPAAHPAPVCRQVAIAVAGVQDHVFRLSRVESQLAAAPIDAAAIARAAKLAADIVDPVDSYHADAPLKRDLLAALLERALHRAQQRATAGAAGQQTASSSKETR